MSNIVIVGAGIAGTALAIALARRGLRPTLLEGRPAPAEASAGIQLGPNATHILQDLGAADRLSRSACRPDAIVARSGRDGRIVQSMPLGDWIADRHGAPYWSCHRRDLHRALTATLADGHGITAEYAFEVVRLSETDGGATVHAASGDVRSGAIVIGADGLWSHIRTHVAPNEIRPFSGAVAARTVVPRTTVPVPMADRTVGIWLSPAGHLVHYPVSGGDAVAVVVVMRRARPEAGWGRSIATDLVADDIRRIAPNLDRSWIAGADWRQWALYRPAPLARWSRGHVVLMGDAAHPVLPYLAQGGVLALEDAVVLADAIAGADDPLAAIAAYEASRRPRAAKVQAASRDNGRIYHLPYPLSVARDIGMRGMTGEGVMRSLDWLYGWRVPHT